MPPGAPPCPADLSTEAKAIWDEIVPELLRVGTLAPCDGGTLSGYCSMTALARKYDAIAEAEPMIETPAGLKPHPCGVEARKLWRLVDRLARDLGLHYTARAITGAPTSRPQDEEHQRRIAETEAFLFGGGRIVVLPGGKRSP